MHRILSILGLACLALLSGCIGPSRQEVLDPMVGQDVNVAIEAFGQPEETIDLGDGRNLYVWRRIYEYDLGHHSSRWFDGGREDWLFDDEPVIVEARICSTRLAVAFDFRIEGWDYGCETVFAEPNGWRTRQSLPAPNEPRRAF
jgi:hypothetical protein